MTPQTGRAMLMDLLKGEVRAGDVRRAVETIEAEARAEVRADLIERVAANAHLVCNCGQKADCPRVHRLSALLRGDKEAGG